MKRGFQNTLAIGAVTAGLALAAAAPASAQVRFEGSLPVPNGRISIGIGDSGFRTGALVPYGYEIYSHPDYGYGFSYRSRWIPVERRGAQWVIVDRPVRFARRDRDDWRFARPYERWEERRADRGDRRGEFRSEARREDSREYRQDRREYREDRRDVRADRRDVRQDRENRRDSREKRDRENRDRNGRDQDRRDQDRRDRHDG